MRMKKYIPFSLFGIVALLVGRAGVEMPEVKKIDEKPVVSKTIQHEQDNPGLKKS